MAKELRIVFSGYDDYTCLVCGKDKADRHVLHQEEHGHTYGGLSFHHSCFDLSEALRLERKEIENARGK